MAAGRVVASGPLAQLQSDPSLPLAQAREAAVSLEAVVEGYEDGLATLSVPGGAFLVPAEAVVVGERRRLQVQAGDVSLALEPPRRSTILNVLPARILGVTPVGAHEMTVVLGLGEQGEGARLLARVTRRSWELLGLAPGMGVQAQVKGVALVGRRG